MKMEAEGYDGLEVFACGRCVKGFEKKGFKDIAYSVMCHKVKVMRDASGW